LHTYYIILQNTETKAKQLQSQCGPLKINAYSCCRSHNIYTMILRGYWRQHSQNVTPFPTTLSHRLTQSCKTVPLIHDGNYLGDYSYKLRALNDHYMLETKW